MVSKTAVTKSTPKAGTAVVSWKGKLKGMAKEAVAVANETGGGGKMISVKAGQLQYDGSAIAGNKLDVIVVHAVLENVYYESDYDSDNPTPPVCFAFGESTGEMAPHEKSAKPQHDGCKGCPMNEFGTAEKGKGKACKNIMRLALIPAKPLTAEAIQKSDVAYMKLPVTSVKGFAAYTKRLATVHELPPLAFVTQIGTEPDAKTQFKVTFQDVAAIQDGEVMEVLMAKHEEQKEAIQFPYQPPAEEEKPAKKPAGKRKF